MAIKVLIVDDHPVVRAGLASALNAASGFLVVGEASNGREAVAKAEQTQPNVVIMDAAMPEMNGIEATRRIRTENPSVRVIALSVRSLERLAWDMLEAGASGYLLKECGLTEIVEAVRAVALDRSWGQPTGPAGASVNPPRSPQANRGVEADVLSPREREVLQLIAEGNTAREIATKLFLSVRTVENHRRNIMGKLGMHKIADLTRYAIRMGIASADQ